MASVIFNSFTEDLARGNIDLDSDTFKMLLVTSSYTPNKQSHNRRDDISNQVTGTGYTAGGVTVAATVTLDTANDRTVVEFASGSWSSSTITARGAVVYKSRGGNASDDELVFYNDFGSDTSSTDSVFVVGPSTITLQN
jgi:hypothetical protein